MVFGKCTLKINTFAKVTVCLFFADVIKLHLKSKIYYRYAVIIAKGNATHRLLLLKYSKKNDCFFEDNKFA